MTKLLYTMYQILDLMLNNILFLFIITYICQEFINNYLLKFIFHCLDHRYLLSILLLYRGTNRSQNIYLLYQMKAFSSP